MVKPGVMTLWFLDYENGAVSFLPHGGSTMVVNSKNDVTIKTIDAILKGESLLNIKKNTRHQKIS